MAFAETLAPFFADFGEAATLAGSPVTVIFDNAYLEVFGNATRVASVQLPESDLGSAVQGSTLVVRSTTYRVTSVEPDGTGLVRLSLERS